MKKFIAGLLVGIILATSLTALAVDEEILAKFTDFNFIILGQAVKLNTQPLIVNGTTYLPVRELCDLLGYDVTYYADSKTIDINKHYINIPDTPNGLVPDKEQLININEEFELDNIDVKVNTFHIKPIAQGNRQLSYEVVVSVDIKFDEIPKSERLSDYAKIIRPFDLILLDNGNNQITKLEMKTKIDIDNLPKENKWVNIELVNGGRSVFYSNKLINTKYMLFKTDENEVKIKMPD